MFKKRERWSATTCPRRDKTVATLTPLRLSAIDDKDYNLFPRKSNATLRRTKYQHEAQASDTTPRDHTSCKKVAFRSAKVRFALGALSRSERRPTSLSGKAHSSTTRKRVNGQVSSQHSLALRASMPTRHSSPKKSDHLRPRASNRFEPAKHNVPGLQIPLGRHLPTSAGNRFSKIPLNLLYACGRMHH
ncbi:hypothetical protein CA51_29780 [Rosistilla oblonga]|nr:hypothetical protein CA51_29780 [Rosistilla oblonga]